MKIRKRGLTNPRGYGILWLTMCVADTGYLGYRTVNGGDVITIKPRLHRYCTPRFFVMLARSRISKRQRRVCLRWLKCRARARCAEPSQISPPPLR